MRLVTSGSTASGSLVLFWPEQLPADFDEQWEDRPQELFEQLQTEKKLLLIDLVPDGAEIYPWGLRGEYSLGLFIDESVSADIEQFCTLEGKHEGVDISGPTWLTGIEHLSRDAALLTKLSRRKANEVAIPADSYSAEIFSANYPDQVYEDWLRDHAGASAQQWWWVQTWFASLGIVVLLIFVLCLFFGTRQSVWISLAVSSALLFIAWLMSRTAGYAQIQQARRSYAAEHPDFVIRLKSASD